MENPWFGPTADVGSTGIITWQGRLTVILGIGGALASHFLLKNNWVAGLCVAVMLAVYFLKYDQDTESY